MQVQLTILFLTLRIHHRIHYDNILSGADPGVASHPPSLILLCRVVWETSTIINQPTNQPAGVRCREESLPQLICLSKCVILYSGNSLCGPISWIASLQGFRSLIFGDACDHAHYILYNGTYFCRSNYCR
jgi:hypothetical protein